MFELCEALEAAKLGSFIMGMHVLCQILFEGEGLLTDSAVEG